MTVRLAGDLAADRYAVAREALAQVPLAVVLIGAADDAARSCATGTAMYVSFSPPRIAIALHPGSRTCRLVEATGEFSASVMTVDQQDAAAAAGRSAPGDDKFAALGLDVREAPDGFAAPALAGSVAALWCRVVDRREVGDHVLFVGEVAAFEAAEDDASPPLLRHRRRYAALGAWLSGEAPEGYPT
jgi:3-hydroxy-9,10-secoandrosta-1,3,5(10)-triene-9,17-dione monooxygenase reductase component